MKNCRNRQFSWKFLCFKCRLDHEHFFCPAGLHSATSHIFKMEATGSKPDCLIQPWRKSAWISSILADFHFFLHVEAPGAETREENFAKANSPMRSHKVCGASTQTLRVKNQLIRVIFYSFHGGQLCQMPPYGPTRLDALQPVFISGDRICRHLLCRPRDFWKAYNGGISTNIGFWKLIGLAPMAKLDYL